MEPEHIQAVWEKIFTHWNNGNTTYAAQILKAQSKRVIILLLAYGLAEAKTLKADWEKLSTIQEIINLLNTAEEYY